MDRETLAGVWRVLMMPRISQDVIGTEVGGRWSFDQRETTCRAIRPGELAEVFGEEGLERVEVLDPQASGYYQPLVVGRRR